MKKHFEHFGWLNFLKSIAATKVFDISGSGTDSIGCARRASCFNVLIYASEDRLYHESEALDWEAKNKT